MQRFGSTEGFGDELGEVELRSLPRPSRLDAALELRGQRQRRAAQALGLETVGDLLEWLPFRHEDRREARTIATLPPGEAATVVAELRRISSRRARNRRTLVEATVADESGVMKAVWFNQPWLVDRLRPGMRLALHGRYGGNRRGFAVSEYEVADGVGVGPVAAAGLVPVYHTTEGLTSQRLRELVAAARPALADVVEPLPAWLRVAERLPERGAALAAVHFPRDLSEEASGRRRLAFEELLLLEVLLAAGRARRAESVRAPSLRSPAALAAGAGRRSGAGAAGRDGAAGSADGAAGGGARAGDGDDVVRPWLHALPFHLTRDQVRACEQIERDIGGEEPMQRLLMGEVGSGKTVVALWAMLRSVEAGHQAALMAPTETLAEQHLVALDRLLGGLRPIELLTGSVPAARRRALLERLGSGELPLVVGTHALIEPSVEFHALGLVVVDEQHRFGVRQRAALEAKGPAGLVPHALHMTATPIPRTLQLTVYGELDVTALRELPAGRRAVETFVASTARERARAYARAREEIGRGRQVFVVCPLIEESDTLQAAAATAEAERLARSEFRAQRVGLIHGQLSSREKGAAMRAFVAGDTDVLVATSVVEVGIDVPNATVMLIEAAERYGLSQLHQLRGRVGRGEWGGVCILFGDRRLPRLKAMAAERDGFRLAEIDLELRGAGDVLGTRQHGLPAFRVARLPSDIALLERARERAGELVARDPAFALAENALVWEAAVARFGADRELIPA